MATKIVSVLTGGTNSHETTSEEINALYTDILSDGIVGAITNTSGVAPTTGGFAVNAQGTPDMTVAVTAGTAYVTGTPTGGNSQRFRVNMQTAENVTIAANSTGGTRYDHIYIKLDPDTLANPNTAGDDVATLVASRSTSSSTDNGTPPTYGYCIAVVTVANGASSITDANITDSRTRTGANSVAVAANVPAGMVLQVQETDYSAVQTGTTTIPYDDTEPQNTEGTEVMSQAITPKAIGNMLHVEATIFMSNSVAGELIAALFQDSAASAVAVSSVYQAIATGRVRLHLLYKVAATSTSATTFKIRIGGDTAGTVTLNGFSGSRKWGATVKSSIKVTEVKV